MIRGTRFFHWDFYLLVFISDIDGQTEIMNSFVWNMPRLTWLTWVLEVTLIADVVSIDRYHHIETNFFQLLIVNPAYMTENLMLKHSALTFQNIACWLAKIKAAFLLPELRNDKRGNIIISTTPLLRYIL